MILSPLLCQSAMHDSTRRARKGECMSDVVCEGTDVSVVPLEECCSLYGVSAGADYDPDGDDRVGSIASCHSQWEISRVVI